MRLLINSFQNFGLRGKMNTINRSHPFLHKMVSKLPEGFIVVTWNGLRHFCKAHCLKVHEQQRRDKPLYFLRPNRLPQE